MRGRGADRRSRERGDAGARVAGAPRSGPGAARPDHARRARIRLGAQGQIGPLGYKIDADFAGNAVRLKDTYVSWDTRVIGRPSSTSATSSGIAVSTATSSMSTPFMERNAVASVGAMQSGYYGLGTTMKLFGDRWHATVSVTGDDIGNADDASDTIAYLARAHWNPLKGNDGFLHLGGWYWDEHLGDDVTSINKTAPIAFGVNWYLTTGRA